MFQTPLEHQVVPSGPGAPKLAPKAAVYFFLVASATVLASALPISHLNASTPGWTTFAILATLSATAQLFVVSGPRHYAYFTTIVFLIPAVMLLPPGLVALVGIIHHLPEWLKTRAAWYIQSFNIFNWTLAMLAAWACFHGFSHDNRVSYAFAGAAAAVALVVVNHVLMAPMLKLARSLSIRNSGLFSFQSLSTDLVLAMLGVATAAFWQANPWLIVFAVAPLFRRDTVRRRDVQRADPGDDLDRSCRLSTRRRRHQRADPPGRPRGLPSEAPGAQPRSRRELRPAGTSRAAAGAAGRGSGERRSRVAAASRGRGIARARAQASSP